MLATKALDAEALDETSQAVAHKVRGAARHSMGKFNLAVQDYSEAIKIEPNYPDAFNNRGTAWFDMGKFLAALADFDKAVELKPDYDLAIFNRARTLLELGFYKKAERDLSILTKLTPDNPLAHYHRGRALISLGRLNKAEQEYTRALELSQNAAEPALARGVLRLRMGRFKEAIKDFNLSSKASPNAAAPHFNRGIALERLKKLKEAEIAYGAAIRNAPSNADAFNNRGNIRAIRGKHGEAIADFTQTLKLEPNHALALINRARSFTALSQPSKAMRDLTKAISIAPELPGAYALRAQIYFNHRDYPSAASDYQAALKQNPKDSMLALRLAESRILAGQANEAIAGLEGLAKSPDSSIRSKALKLKGRASFMWGEFKHAREDFQEHLKLSDSSPYAYIWLKFAALRLGKQSGATAPECAQAQWPCPIIRFIDGTTSASSALLAAGKSPEKQTEALFAIAQVHLAKGERVKAVRVLKSILEANVRYFTEYPVAKAQLKRLGF